MSRDIVDTRSLAVSGSNVARSDEEEDQAVRLTEFAVTGEGVYDEVTGDVVRPAEPSRSLVRYRDDGTELLVHVRMNLPLLAAAASLPVLVLQPTQPTGELVPGGRSLTPAGSVRNFELLERICDELVAEDCPARQLAVQAGAGRRDFYFATEDAACLERIARRAAEALAFPLAVEEHTLADVAALILPTELVGELDLPVTPDQRIHTRRFEFWGAEASLERLRRELERRGYRFVGIERATSELRVLKEVPIDGAGFLAVLREIVPLSRSLRCSYRGTETVDGFEQFALTRPLPPRFSADGEGRKGVWARLFGTSGG
jgi:hypothetical protein